MLRLHFETDPAWGGWAARHLDEILLDHAHCEKKAAGAAVNLVFRYPEHARLARPLSELAREELAHFEAVLAMLESHDLGFVRQRPSPYAGRLHAVVRREEPGRLLDLLLCCAAIEARSCERLGLLADALPEGRLRELYRGLLAAEARHHGLYLELARGVAAPAEVKARLETVLEHESAILREAPPMARLHAGPCVAGDPAFAVAGA